MKTKQSLVCGFGIYAAIAVLLALAFTSCKTEEDPADLYAGIWVGNSDFGQETIVIANDFTFVVYNQDNVPVVKGTMSINNETVILNKFYEWNGDNWQEWYHVYTGTVNGYSSGSAMIIFTNNNIPVVYIKL